MPDAAGSGNRTPKKRSASALRRPASGVFNAVIAGADEVVANSFIAQGVFNASATGPAPGTPPPAAPSHLIALGPQRVPNPGSSSSAAMSAVLDSRRSPVDTQVLSGSFPVRTVAAPDNAGEPPAPTHDDGAKRRAAGRRSGKPWAQQAVTESFVDAVVSSNTWTTHGFRIVPDVLTALKVRLAMDRRTCANPKLAVGHYLDAALRHAPTDVAEQVASAQAFLSQRMGIVDSGRQSTYRVGSQARALATSLNAALQEADHGRKGIFVVSASLQALLQALDAEGPLQRPPNPNHTHLF